MTHVNLPERLKPHLKDHEFAHYIGVSPGGVDWVAYRPENVQPMKQALRCLILRWALSTLPKLISEQRRAERRREQCWYHLYQITYRR